MNDSRSCILNEEKSSPYYNLNLDNGDEAVAKVISDNVITLRKKYGLTQMELAKRVSFSNRTISSIESGGTIPSALFLYRLCNSFNISADVILAPGGASGDFKVLTEKGDYSQTRSVFPFTVSETEKKLIVYLHFLGDDNRKRVLSLLQKFFNSTNE